MWEEPHLGFGVQTSGLTLGCAVTLKGEGFALHTHRPHAALLS